MLIGKPDSAEGDARSKRCSSNCGSGSCRSSSSETYERQRAAADKLRILNESQAQANMQTD